MTGATPSTLGDRAGRALREHPRAADLLHIHGPLAIVALLELIAIQHFGAYHARLWGWLALAAVAAALWFAVRTFVAHLANAERVGASPRAYLREFMRTDRWRSPATVGRVATLALTAWTFASLSWAVYSHHLAWDEANRTLGYTALLAVGGGLCWNTRRLAAAVAWMCAAIAAAGVILTWRLGWGADPSALFVAGRLSNPIGYSNGQAALELFGAVAALGCAALHEQRARAASERLPLEQSARALVERGLLRERAWAHPHVVPDVVWSGLWTAAAGMAGALVYLAQSRGTVLAAIPALIALVALAPRRITTLLRLAVVAVLIGLEHAKLAAPFEALGNANRALTSVPAKPAAVHAAGLQKAAALQQTATDSLRSAAHSVVLIGACSAIAGVLVAALVLGVGWLMDRPRDPEPRGVRPDPASVRLATIAVMVALGAAAFAVVTTRTGTPTHWLHEQYDACVHPTTVHQTFSSSSHFADVGTNRCDFWRVELHDFASHPLLGVGANNFQGPYVLLRRSTEEPLQDHSLGLQLLGELGVVGFALGLGLVIAAVFAVLRFTGSGPLRSPAIAAGVAATVGWFAQANIDWLWDLPGVTIPAVLITGGLLACASPRPLRTIKVDGAAGLTAPPGARSRSLAQLIAGPVVVGAACLLMAAGALLPPALADRDERLGIDPTLQMTNPAKALADVEAAGRWDPTWAEPLLEQAALRLKAGDRAGALAATQAAINREPANWSVWFTAAQVYNQLGLRSQATAALAAAKARNPELTATLPRVPRRAPARHKRTTK